MNGSTVSCDKSEASDRHPRVPTSATLGISKNNWPYAMASHNPCFSSNYPHA
jgi:hypothetical protein